MSADRDQRIAENARIEPENARMRDENARIQNYFASIGQNDASIHDKTALIGILKILERQGYIKAITGKSKGKYILNISQDI